MSLEVKYQDNRFCLSLLEAHNFILSDSIFLNLGIFTKDIFQRKIYIATIFIMVQCSVDNLKPN